MADHYLSRAAEQLVSALNVFTREASPRRFAEIHTYSAAVLTQQASLIAASGRVPNEEVQQARGHFETAAKAFEAIGDTVSADACRDQARQIRIVQEPETKGSDR